MFNVECSIEYRELYIEHFLKRRDSLARLAGLAKRASRATIRAYKYRCEVTVPSSSSS